MATVEEIKIVVKAETDAAIAKLLQLEGAISKNQSAFAKMRDVMQGPIAAFNQVTAIIGKVKQVSDAMESSWGAQAEAASLLANAVKTTGAGAWTSSGQLEAMAGKLQKVTKYGDETVESMQTVLLGFRNITGNEFDHATTAILDMATVMKMDLTSAAQAVGKALDNPILGIDSLSRQGFKFTAQEKEMMKAMVEAGNIAGAQKIILDELDKTYGGAAEEAGKLATNLKVRLANSIGDVSEEIGRQISNNLAPWRLKWIAMADAIGVAMKAQNDFSEAMDKASKGTATTQDKITIANDYLKVLENMATTAGRTGSALEEMYGGTEEVQAQIEAQKSVIASLKEQDRLQKLYAAASAGRDAAATAAAKKLADAAAWQADLDGKRLAIASEYADRIKTIGLLRLTGKEAEEAKLSAVEAQSEAYAALIVSMNLSKGATTGSLAASLEMAEKLKNAFSGGSIGPFLEEQKEFNMFQGEYLAMTDKSIAAQAKAAQGTREAQAAMDAYNQSASTAIVYVQTLAKTQQAQADAAMSGYQSMAGALGAALVTGEDGWKAFGRAGLNAVAAVVEAMAIESDVLIAGALAKLLLGDFTKIPGLGAAITASALAHGSAGAIRAIPMAEGGSGIVTKPTLFLAGEAGPEPFAFGGANNKRGMGGTTVVNNTVIQNIGGSVIAERRVQSLAMNGMAKAARGY